MFYLCLFVYSGVLYIVLCFCSVCLRLVPCVPNAASFSGLSICDYAFDIYKRLLNKWDSDVNMGLTTKSHKTHLIHRKHDIYYSDLLFYFLL